MESEKSKKRSRRDEEGGVERRIAERRTSIRRRRRRGRLKRVFRAMAVVAVLVAIGGLLFSPPLRVSSVRVEGTSATDSEELAVLADAMGRPLLLVNTTAMAERVKASPRVLDAHIRTDFLRRSVTIEVVERLPIAFSRSGPAFLLVDRFGMGLELTDTAPGDLFYLTGNIGPREVGEVSEAAGWAAVSAEEISRWSKYGVVTAGYGDRGIVLTTSDGVKIFLGDAERLDEKGRVVRAVQAKAEAEQWNIRHVDVANPENPAVLK